MHGAAGGGAPRPGHRPRRQHRRRPRDQRARRRVPRRSTTSPRSSPSPEPRSPIGTGGLPFRHGLRDPWARRRWCAISTIAGAAIPARTATGPPARRRSSRRRGVAGSHATCSGSRSCTTRTWWRCLRDKRWHSATGRILELQGITDPQYLATSPDVDPVGRGRRAHPPAALGRPRLLAAGRRSAAAVHARGDQRAASTRSRRRDEPTSPSTSASRTRSRSSASCSARPKADWKLFSRWATDILRIFYGTLDEDLPVIVAPRTRWTSTRGV